MVFFEIFWIISTVCLIIYLMKAGIKLIIHRKVFSDQLITIISLCQTSIILFYRDFINSIFSFFSERSFSGGHLLAIDGLSDAMITILPIIFDLIIYSAFLSNNRKRRIYESNSPT